MIIAAKILASPWTDLLLWLGFLAPGLLLLGAVVAGHLARRGAPVLATRDVDQRAGLRPDGRRCRER